MKITWVSDTSGLELRPTWEVEKVCIHTVKNFFMFDGTRKDQIVLCVFLTADQYISLVEEYGKHNFAPTIMGVYIIPLVPHAILWTWAPPPEYPRLPTYQYTGFELTEDEP